LGHEVTVSGPPVEAVTQGEARVATGVNLVELDSNLIGSPSNILNHTEVIFGGDKERHWSVDGVEGNQGLCFLFEESQEVVVIFGVLLVTIFQDILSEVLESLHGAGRSLTLTVEGTTKLSIEQAESKTVGLPGWSVD